MARYRQGSGLVETRTEDSGSQALMELMGRLPPEALRSILQMGRREGEEPGLFMGQEPGPIPIEIKPPPPPPWEEFPERPNYRALPPGQGPGPQGPSQGPVGAGSALSRRGVTTVTESTPFTIPVEGMNVDPRFFMGIEHMNQARRDGAISGPGLSEARLEELLSSSKGIPPALDPSLRRSDPLSVSARGDGGR